MEDVIGYLWLIAILVIVVKGANKIVDFFTVDNDQQFKQGYDYIYKRYHSGRSYEELEVEVEICRWDHNGVDYHDKGADAALREIYRKEEEIRNSLLGVT